MQIANLLTKLINCHPLEDPGFIMYKDQRCNQDRQINWYKLTYHLNWVLQNRLEEIHKLSKLNKIDAFSTTATFETRDNSLSQSREGATEIFHISIRFIYSVSLCIECFLLIW